MTARLPLAEVFAIADQTARKFAQKFSRWHQLEDLVQAARLAAWTGRGAFDPTRGASEAAFLTSIAYRAAQRESYGLTIPVSGTSHRPGEFVGTLRAVPVESDDLVECPDVDSAVDARCALEIAAAMADAAGVSMALVTGFESTSTKQEFDRVRRLRLRIRAQIEQHAAVAPVARGARVA